MVAIRPLRRLSGVSPSVLALVVLLCAAFALRVFNLNWDEGTYLHPDEAHVADVATARISLDWPPDFGQLLDPASSPLNPRADNPETGEAMRYAYGALPLIVTKLTATVMTEVTGTDWTSFFNRIHLVGRVLSAVFDTLTVLVVYLIGVRVFNRRIGLLSALLYAFAPVAFQLAHFYTTDSWLTFFVALSLLFAIAAVHTGNLKSLLASGVAFGFAMASKGSVPTLGAVLLIAALLSTGSTNPRGAPLQTFRGSVARVCTTMLAAVAAFALFEPYALARPGIYIDQLLEQSRIVAGSLDVPFTRQYVGTIPAWYQISQLTRWGLGPVSGLMCLAGAILLARETLRVRSSVLIVLTAWLLFQGLVVMLPETKFVRYTAPILPVLAIAGGLAIERLRALSARYWNRAGAAAVLVAVIAGVALWTLSFSSVYAGRHPRLEASRWIYEHVPSGSVIGMPTWDETLPVPLGIGLTPWDFQYQFAPVELYLDRPPNEVADDLYQTLERSDYLVLASNRVQRGIEALPWRYPAQNAFYQLLERGQLGFELTAEFRRAPGLFGLAFDDQDADESLLNYDHPRVLIYRKNSLVPRATYDLLMSRATDQPFIPERHLSEPTLMLDQPVSEIPTVNDARWSAALTDNSAIALLVWIVLLVVLQQAGLPIARLVFSRFADGGLGFARLLALMIAGYVIWLGASLEAISFRVIWCWVGVAVVFAAGLALRRSSTWTKASPEGRSAAIGGETVFWVVFAVFLAFRWVNPDSWHPEWGGEKPMEFAHLNAILRSAHFPPYDPWFSDGYINYYYYGLYLVAFCFKLTGIPSEIAFNLAQPTVMALLASCGYSVAATLGRAIARRVSPVIPGVAGALLIVGIGNLVAVAQIVDWFPERPQVSFFGLTWAASRAITGAITEFPYFTGLYADLHAHVVALPMTVLAVGLCYAIAAEPRLTLLALSETPARHAARRMLAVRLLLLSLVLGSIFPTNAWDVPVYAALGVVSIWLAIRMLPSLQVRFAIAGLVAAVVGAMAYLLFLPFHSNYVALFSSIGRTRAPTDFWQFASHLGGLLTIAGLGIVVAGLSITSSRREHLAFPALPLALVGGSFLLAGTARDRVDWLADGALRGAILVVAGLLVATLWPAGIAQRRLDPGYLAGIAGLVLAVAAVVAGRLVLGLALAFATAGAMLWLQQASVALRFTGVLIAAAASVMAGVELIYVVDDLSPDPVWYRMNTVFKFYNQVWILLALAGASLLAELWQRATATSFRPAAQTVGIVATGSESTQAASPQTPPETRSGAAAWARFGLLISAIVILVSLSYPALATGPRLALRFPGHPSPGTLNALDWMRYGTLTNLEGQTIRFDGDREVIDWFNSEVEGAPVIAEASIGPYRGNGSRISIATGLPTILGWARHEYQQRYATDIPGREMDARTLYNSPDPQTKLEILYKYGVQYIIVGDVERMTILDGQRYASEAGLAAFDEMVGESLEIAFQAGTTTVYRVKPAG